MRLRPLLAAVLDAASVLVFAAVGQASHDESGGIEGVLRIAWPFLTGAAVGWAGHLVARRRPPTTVTGGLVVWVATVGIGMVLRAATGAGVALSFVIVAGVVLAVLLLGWRTAVALVDRRRHGAGTSTAPRPVAKA